MATGQGEMSMRFVATRRGRNATVRTTRAPAAASGSGQAPVSISRRITLPKPGGPRTYQPVSDLRSTLPPPQDAREYSPSYEPEPHTETRPKTKKQKTASTSQVPDVVENYAERSSPLMKLPIEMHEEIIKHAVADASFEASQIVGGTKKDELLAYYRRLVRLAQVCSTWRQLTVKAPHLWVRIHNDFSDNFVRKCLARSQTSLLDVYFDMKKRGWWDYRWAEEITQNSSRWRSLTASTDEWIVTRDVLSLPMPALESLSLDCGIRIRVMEQRGGKLFGGAPPRALRHLRLVNTLVDLARPEFGRLESIMIHSYACHVLHAGEFYEMLSACSATLRDLELWLEGWPQTRGAPQNRPVSLPYLRNVKLMGVDVDWDYLLGMMSIPMEATLELDWSSYKDERGANLAFGRYLSQRYASTDVSRELKVVHTPRQQWPVQSTFTLTFGSKGTLVLHRTKTETALEAIKTLRRITWMPDITSLTVTDRNKRTSLPIIQLLLALDELCPGVDRLTLESSLSDEVLRWLSMRDMHIWWYEQGFSLKTDGLLFPSMTTLRVMGVQGEEEATVNGIVNTVRGRFWAASVEEDADEIKHLEVEGISRATLKAAAPLELADLLPE